MCFLPNPSIFIGLFDVIPARALDGLSAEDLRLLLNGVGDINVATLISYTSFNDESGETPDRYTQHLTGTLNTQHLTGTLSTQHLTGTLNT